MMVQVNLLPIEYQQRQARMRRLRVWATAAVVIFLVQVAAGIGLGRLAAETREVESQMAVMKAQQHDLGQNLAALTAERTALARRLDLAEQLRHKHRWSGVLAEVANAVPPAVVLTSIGSEPPRMVEARSTNGGKSAAADTLVEPVAEGLTVTGVAANHEAIAAFLANLNEATRLGLCELGQTGRQPFLEGEGVAFTIYARWQ